MIANGKHDWVELNHILHESPQSGHGGGQGINTGASRRNHSSGGGASLLDEPTTNDDSSKKAHAAIRSESSLLRAEPTP